MSRRSQILSLFFLGVLFLGLVALSFWHTSLSFGDFRPNNAAVTVVLWGILTLVALGVFALGFILFRNLLKLYIERRQGRLGSKIKTRLVSGALILSVVPVVALVIFSFTILSRTYDKWFSYPTKEILQASQTMAESLNEIMRQKTETDAAWIASMPETAAAFDPGLPREEAAASLTGLADRVRAQYAGLLPPGASRALAEVFPGGAIQGPVEWRLPKEAGVEGAASGIAQGHVWAAAPVRSSDGLLGRVVVVWSVPGEILDGQSLMASNYDYWASLEAERRNIRYNLLALMSLITVFVLFTAVWLSLFLSKQISVPIEALVTATSEVSSGRLGHRVRTPAIDELAGLVDSFNHMTQRLEEQTTALQQSNRDLEQANAELDARRRFINAILESITPGVFSVNEAGEILKANSAVGSIFGLAGVPRGMSELFREDDLAELRYMLNRARRTGFCTRDFEIQRRGRILHLAVTVSALEEQDEVAGDRYVVVVEDTTELLRAQKSAAWNEVARRVAHEIKNPLTPIALSAERMQRLLDRLEATMAPEERRELRDRFDRSTGMIVREVETLRRLVDEFSQFARLPKVEPARTDLNRTVAQALEVFEGRLDQIALRVETASGLPDVMVDPEQFKRVVVNLVDNAAEALQGAWFREILVSTKPGRLPEIVELTISDSGPGISPEDKERLFLPYFSTKKRGTGLGLAIVSRIVAEHGGSIRVEDNRPSGSRFIVEIPAAETAAHALTVTRT